MADARGRGCSCADRSWPTIGVTATGARSPHLRRTPPGSGRRWHPPRAGSRPVGNPCWCWRARSGHRGRSPRARARVPSRCPGQDADCLRLRHDCDSRRTRSRPGATRGPLRPEVPPSGRWGRSRTSAGPATASRRTSTRPPPARGVPVGVGPSRHGVRPAPGAARADRSTTPRPTTRCGRTAAGPGARNCLPGWPPRSSTSGPWTGLRGAASPSQRSQRPEPRRRGRQSRAPARTGPGRDGSPCDEGTSRTPNPASRPRMPGSATTSW